MKKVKLILIFLVVFFVLGSVAVIFLHTGINNEEKNETSESVRAQEETELSAEETIAAFVDQIYTYDTNERKFYEGADRYMTREAYERIAPMINEEETVTDVHAMSSELLELTTYYRLDQEDELQVMIDVWYKTSGTGEFRIRQIAKIQLIKEEKWLIDDFTVIDTLEE